MRMRQESIEPGTNADWWRYTGFKKTLGNDWLNYVRTAEHSGSQTEIGPRD